jgi:hypothetical protein
MLRRWKYDTGSVLFKSAIVYFYAIALLEDRTEHKALHTRKKENAPILKTVFSVHLLTSYHRIVLVMDSS